MFGPNLGASQAVFLWEGGITLADLPEKLAGGPNGRGLRLNGPGTPVSGNAPLAGAHFGEVEDQGDFASESSWGFRLIGRLDYLSLIGPWNVSPRLAYSYDVNGISPGPGGQFREGRQALTAGVRSVYQNQWEVDVSYTTFWGADRFNLSNDRDFIAANIRYSF